MATRTKLINIGNSRGIRVPAAILRTIGAVDEVDLDVVDGAIVLRPCTSGRAGWDAACLALADMDDDIEPVDWIANSFDEDDWEWP